MKSNKTTMPGIASWRGRILEVKTLNWERPNRSGGPRQRAPESTSVAPGRGLWQRIESALRMNKFPPGNWGKSDTSLPAEKHTVLSVIDEYLDLFCNEETVVLPSTTKGRHEIRTRDALPIKKNPYRVPYTLKEEIKCWVKEWLLLAHRRGRRPRF
jgi:hypothetical protein